MNKELRQRHDEQANHCVEKSILGFTDTIAVTTRGDKLKTGNYDHNDSDYADHPTQRIHNLINNTVQSSAA